MHPGSVADRLAFWRAPAGQPAWVRPALLVVAAAAALAYGWGMGSAGLEPYYAAAVRSMSVSWRNFVFGALDPAGTMTVDKIPGAFWPQALSVRLFGVHRWAIVLPQVVEGALTILVLFRAVRRLAGPLAGLTAAAVLAISPVTVALNRGNLPDTLMILMLVLAADATTAAIVTGRRRWLVLAGGWLGIGFHAKMTQAWMVAPALVLAYLVAADGPVRRKLGALLAFAGVGAAVSLLWVAVVTLTPAGSRPYIDGSRHNSAVEQVFVYNGLARFGGPAAVSPFAGPAANYEAPMEGQADWTRLFHGQTGRDIAWLLPVAVVAAVVVLVRRWRAPRDDRLRTGVLLWGGWLLTAAVVFSGADQIRPYYTAALSPAIGALVGLGVVAARWGPGLLAGVTAASTAAQLALLPEVGDGQPAWLRPALLLLGLAAIGALVVSAFRSRWRTAAVVLAAVSVVLVPVAASTAVVAKRFGPFDSPFQPAFATAYTRNGLIDAPAHVRETLPELQRVRAGAANLLATYSSFVAANLIFESGEQVLPIGGFTGTVPSPTLDEIRTLIARGDLHLVIAPQTDDPRIAWIIEHCRAVRRSVSAGTRPGPPLYAYFCVPADARAQP